MANEFEPRNITQQGVLRDIPPGRYYIGSDSGSEVDYGEPGRILDFQEGAFPDPPIDEIQGILTDLNQRGKLLDAVLFMREDREEPFKNNIRELLNISDKDEVEIFSGIGQDGIIQNVVTKSMDPMSAVVAPAPFYPHLVNAVNIVGRGMPLVPIEVPLGEPFEDAVIDTMEFRRDINVEEDGPALIFINSPCSPTGETVSTDILEKVIEVADRGGDPKLNDTVYIDMALGFDLEQARVLAKLASKHPNVILGFSITSKEFGASGMRHGFAVMSKEVGKIYKNSSTIFDQPGMNIEIMNELSDPARVKKQLQIREKTTTYWKKKFMIAMAMLNEGSVQYPIEVLRTDPSSLVMVLSAEGNKGSLWETLKAHNIMTANGEIWSDSHSQMTDNQVRIVPPMNQRDFNEFMRRLYIIIHRIGVNSDQARLVHGNFMKRLAGYPPPPEFDTQGNLIPSSHRPRYSGRMRE